MKLPSQYKLKFKLCYNSPKNECLVQPGITLGSFPKGDRIHNCPLGIKRICLREEKSRELSKWAEQQEKRQKGRRKPMHQWEPLGETGLGRMEAAGRDTSWWAHPASIPRQESRLPADRDGNGEGLLSRDILVRLVLKKVDSKMIWWRARESFKETPTPRSHYNDPDNRQIWSWFLRCPNSSGQQYLKSWFQFIDKDWVLIFRIQFVSHHLGRDPPLGLQDEKELVGWTFGMGVRQQPCSKPLQQGDEEVTAPGYWANPWARRRVTSLNWHDWTILGLSLSLWTWKWALTQTHSSSSLPLTPPTSTALLEPRNLTHIPWENLIAYLLLLLWLTRANLLLPILYKKSGQPPIRTQEPGTMNCLPAKHQHMTPKRQTDTYMHTHISRDLVHTHC